MRYLAQRKGGAGLPERQRIAAAIVAGMFPEQRAFACSTAKQRLARCGRRAGKTTGVAGALILSVLARPGNQAAYIALTRDNAKLLLAPELERLAAAYQIPITINRQDLIAYVGEKRDGVIFLRGADNERAVDKLRSFHFELIALDEMAFYGPHIAKLVDSLEATMMDRQGAMLAISSPGYVCAGKFWDLDQPTSGWERHHWTVLNNPHIPHAEAWLAQLRAQRGWASDDPTFLREYMGQWVDDARSLCFPFAPGLNLYEDLPVGPDWHHVLGVDVGYDPDPSAFVVLAYHPTHRIAYVRHSQREDRWLPKQVWWQARQLAEKYRVEKVAVDATKGQVAEWAERFAVPVTIPRHKSAKAMHIAHIADDMRQGFLKFRSGSDEGLIHECRTVAWDAERKRPDPRMPNDLTDALQYAWTECTHFSAGPVRNQPTRDEVVDAEVIRMQRRAEQVALRDGAPPEDDFFLGL